MQAIVTYYMQTISYYLNYQHKVFRRHQDFIDVRNISISREFQIFQGMHFMLDCITKCRQH